MNDDGVCKAAPGMALPGSVLINLEVIQFTWTVMRFETLLLTEKLHANRAVRDLEKQQLQWDLKPLLYLFIGVPGAEVCEEVVFLIEVKRADKTLECSPEKRMK